MKNEKNSKQLSTAALLLMLLLTTSILAVVPFADAAVFSVDTNAYIMLAPNPVGVNQPVLVSYRIDKVKAGATDLLNHFEGFAVTITKPDGTVERRTDLDVDSTSGGWFMYTPTQVGTYKFQTHFPAQWSNVTANQIFYKASDSAIVSLTVQQEPIQGIPNNPLPTDAWKRPINAENKGWSAIADNWLMRSYDIPNRSFCMTCAVAPYTSAPNSAHILWAKPIIFGGQGGGKFGDASYYTGLSYEQFYLPLILEGRIIYTEHNPTTTTALGTVIMDLYTGQQIMYLNNTDIIFAQVLQIDNPNEHGLIAYLWSVSGATTNATFTLYDAFTGREHCKVTNVTWGGLGSFNAGPTMFGPKGEVLSYAIVGTAPNQRLIRWNSTRAIYTRGAIDTWSPAYGSIIDGSRGIEYNVSISISGLSIAGVTDDYILAQKRDTNTFPYVQTDACFDAKTGQLLWSKDRTEIYQAFFAMATSIRDGIYVLRDEGRMVTYAYSIRTGNQLWVTDPLPNGWGVFEYQRDIAYGKVYTTGYTGAVRAYNATNGRLVWTFDMGSAGYETVYGVYPSYNGFTVADGKIFVTADEHSPDAVLWRGGKLWAINTTDGKEVWSIAGMMRNPAVSDGILTALNSYDGQVYAFGKGPSATTVTAPDTAVPLGTGVMIRGSVTDQSPGQKGTPAVSDESMSAWMEYLYMQRPRPTNVKGVEVVLTAIDPNGNFQNIGTVRTDESGNFGIMWVPPVEGTYKVTATFKGTNSYSSSYATTYFGVCPAAAAPQPTASPTVAPTAPPTVSPTPTVSPSVVPEPEAPAPSMDVYIIAAAAVVIIAIVIVAVLVLRKRK
ncbi:MAG: PQQ-binding-like beta-propeller repeat protein [Candidatus Bathyarchaeota archaeon]|nr:PQQ-binding-like beta-propeller repeat protein [Candidatus Bathyarchaeota archaeon]